jgi:hypothetical protein
MSDLVKQIREWQEKQKTYDPEPWDFLCYAADEIETLTSIIDSQAIAIDEVIKECKQLERERDEWKRKCELNDTALAEGRLRYVHNPDRNIGNPGVGRLENE